MTTPSEAPEAVAPLGLMSRITGVLFTPRETFKRIVAVPRPLGLLICIALFLAVATFTFLSTEVGRRALLDQQVSGMEAFGMQVSDEMYAQMESRLGFAQYTGAIGQLIAVPIIYLIFAGLLFAIFNAGMGGDATYKQVFTVVVHSGVVGVVQQIFVLPLNYFRESMSSPTNLAALLPMIPEGTFWSYLLGAIDVFLIWWLVVMAIGLAVLYKRRTQPVAVILFSIYGVIALAIAGVRSAFGGS